MFKQNVMKYRDRFIILKGKRRCVKKYARCEKCVEDIWKNCASRSIESQSYFQDLLSFFPAILFFFFACKESPFLAAEKKERIRIHIQMYKF